MKYKKQKRMNKEDFLLKDKVKDIETNFIKNGWITVFEDRSTNMDDSSGIYCCLINKNQKEIYNNDHAWLVSMGREGKPSVYGDNSYKTYDNEGLEPFLFRRHFPLLENKEIYFDISEEFVLYFNLYEKGESKQNRKYYYINKIGNLDEVILIEPDSIKVKLRYLKEYITIRDMNFVVCYDFMKILSECPPEWEIKFRDQIYKTNNYTYRYLIQQESNNTQSWILGNVFIDCNKEKTYHFNKNEEKYESFITGYDENGDEIRKDCSTENGITYFKKEVLDEYYNKPSIYKVDGFTISSKFFTLKIDNNVDNYVPVFLTYLKVLPHVEQLHWKQYNIPPQPEMSISNTYYEVMINGNFVDHPEAIDIFFKFKYEEFNENWEKKFGWKFYKPLSEDKFRFKSLHIPTTNNIKAFYEQILSLSIITIDRLNEKEISEQLPNVSKKMELNEFKTQLLEKEIDIPENIIIQNKAERGLAKLERFLKHNGYSFTEMNKFLRTLHDLRSGISAHGFSNSNDKCKKAIKYFEIKDDNYIEVARNIFVKSINTLNTLEKHFNIKEG